MNADADDAIALGLLIGWNLLVCAAAALWSLWR